MQFQSGLSSENDLRTYWKKPYSVKPEMGFYSWTKDKVKLRVVDDTEHKIPEYFESIVLDFFSNEAKLKLFIELKS